jgi:hypothetical protein
MKALIFLTPMVGLLLLQEGKSNVTIALKGI